MFEDNEDIKRRLFFFQGSREQRVARVREDFGPIGVIVDLLAVVSYHNTPVNTFQPWDHLVFQLFQLHSAVDTSYAAADMNTILHVIFTGCYVHCGDIDPYDLDPYFT